MTNDERRIFDEEDKEGLKVILGWPGRQLLRIKTKNSTQNRFLKSKN